VLSGDLVAGLTLKADEGPRTGRGGRNLQAAASTTTGDGT
jgi:hypothetical protein